MVKIKEWRQGLGITQKALADAAGLDLRWVQKLEAGDIDIQNVTVKRCKVVVETEGSIVLTSPLTYKISKFPRENNWF